MNFTVYPNIYLGPNWQFLRSNATFCMLQEMNGVRSGFWQEVETLSLYLRMALFGWLVGWLVDFLTSSSTTRLYRRRATRLTSDKYKCCHTRDRAGRPGRLYQPVTLY